MHFGTKTIRQCSDTNQNPNLRNTFPDLDYAFLGYDIIKGYPNSNGHDPGFAHQIFSADYSKDQQTADCRYSIPKGLSVIPDVSCVTSFASTIIQNTFELHKSLSTSVSASGGFGAFSFSASSSYKKTSSEVSSGEKVYITSSAKCSYYFSRVDFTDPPPLHPGFIRSAKSLEKNHTTANLIKFVKYYGTHFPTTVVFGARFLKQYSMSSQSYKTASSRSISVSAQASYSGLISVSGGFSLDKSEREAASQFSKEVETTTVTVGAAPPSNGEAAYWAATVKENPVPTSYKIQPISNLFTSVFMKGTGINYDFLRKKLVGIEKSYCKQLLLAGTVNNCDESVSVGIIINHYTLPNDISKFTAATESSCISRCFEHLHCLAIVYTTTSSDNCFFYDANQEHIIPDKSNAKAKIIIFPTKIRDDKKDFKVKNLRVSTQARPNSTTTVDAKSCRKTCDQDSSCDVFSFCSAKSSCSSERNNCRLYSSKSVITFEKAENKFEWITYFIS
ncbi:uncharacterized protein LOC114535684 [Dendronephthya gigantea]|uniref:uncharacterized protein LOC114535684 n=1 Tax=Dendronephthya gigantea TaxID=151771 RepID=UPI00106B1FED|nr:uncharacterized protein LOC114535684 [Dendronephthya gigantea]